MEPSTTITPNNDGTVSLTMPPSRLVNVMINLAASLSCRMKASPWLAWPTGTSIDEDGRELYYFAQQAKQLEIASVMTPEDAAYVASVVLEFVQYCKRDKTLVNALSDLPFEAIGRAWLRLSAQHRTTTMAGATTG